MFRKELVRAKKWVLGEVIIVGVFLACLTPGVAETKSFSGWPQTWVDACERFEAYNASREKYFPASHLQISPDGQITHHVQLFTSRTEHLTLDFFRNGSQTFGMVLESDSILFGSGRERLFPPATYTAVLKTTGSAGFQYLYPILWFKTNTPDQKAERFPRSPDGLQVRTIPPPEPAESVWPNARILKFLDFHIFPKYRRDDIFEKNSKVSPNLTLTLSNSGVVTREVLGASLEKLLRWRIYHNGKLIKQGPAGGTMRLDVGEGPGTYQVFVGVDCPHGFMPVSNLLEFPLFPEKSGGVAVFPTVTNIERFPDFLLDMLPPEDRTALMAVETETAVGYYNTRSIYFMSPNASFGDRTKDELFRLWTVWGLDVTHGINGSGGVLGRTIDKPKPLP